MRGTRPYRHICLPPLVRARLACSYCMRSQPRVALPNRLTHAAGSFITRRPCGRSWTVRTHSVFYRPAGRECERRASRYTCGSLSLPLDLSRKCARSPIHWLSSNARPTWIAITSRSSSRVSSASRISRSSGALFPSPKSLSRWGSSPQ